MSQIWLVAAFMRRFVHRQKVKDPQQVCMHPGRVAQP